jgi:hypothetical protein
LSERRRRRAELDEAYAEAERYAWEEIGRRLPPVNPTARSRSG